PGPRRPATGARHCSAAARTGTDGPAGVARAAGGGATLRPGGGAGAGPARLPRADGGTDARPADRGTPPAGAALAATLRRERTPGAAGSPTAAVRGGRAMNLPLALFTIRCLVAETFRQSMAARTFWLLLVVSGVCIVFCLSVSVEGAAAYKPP